MTTPIDSIPNPLLGNKVLLLADNEFRTLDVTKGSLEETFASRRYIISEMWDTNGLYLAFDPQGHTGPFRGQGIFMPENMGCAVLGRVIIFAMEGEELTPLSPTQFDYVHDRLEFYPNDLCLNWAAKLESMYKEYRKKFGPMIDYQSPPNFPRMPEHVAYQQQNKYDDGYDDDDYD